jgi:hypothetical protein
VASKRPLLVIGDLFLPRLTSKMPTVTGTPLQNKKQIPCLRQAGSLRSE